MTYRSRARRGTTAAAVPTLALTLALALTACGSDSEPSGTKTPTAAATPSSQLTATPGPDAKVIEITVTADDVTPAGQRVEVEVDQPVVLKINATQPGELHVHSSPEQEIAYPAGASEATLQIDRPGIVDVEDHDLGTLIIQLEVQ